MKEVYSHSCILPWGIHTYISDLGYTHTQTFQTWGKLTLILFRPGIYSHSCISDLGYTHTHIFQTWSILTLILFRPGVYLHSNISDLGCTPHIFQTCGILTLIHFGTFIIQIYVHYIFFNKIYLNFTKFWRCLKIAVLRIRLILMRIRIFDRTGKIDPDPGSHRKKLIRIRIQIQVISLKFTEFLTKQNFQICCLILFAYFNAIIRKFYYLSFFNSSDLGFESKIFFAVFRWYFAPWYGSGSRKPKSCGSNGSGT